ncbi:hypothetical protein GYMLUDRAFT_87461 [Collybiopsis luxurians FD-317 M1]|uniref:Uncharacterized protein n=1 Tax=Collybiopsis luxurians FD-317 M1 TaxID=944289 RepID=A0A0D0CD60_9AGAR|nr:hypothetical protein GYMLUDRAFT_87461 [Collybiopsis luxurians FD-317 M1]
MSDILDLPPPPPPGLNYIAAIRPSLNFILVLTPLGASLVPLIFTLFYFSTPQTRRHPVFILNVLACCSGICEAAINAALETKQILYPLEPVSKGLLTAVIAFATVSPVVIDSILLFRVIAFYPIETTPKRVLVSILALPVIVKSGRFIAVVLYLNSFTHTSGRLPNVLLAAESTWPRNPYIMTEWSLQMVDNLYASSFFLYKLWLIQRPTSNTVMIRSKSLLLHLRSLFLIALGNFIFPVIMNIASIVLIARDPSFTNGSYVLLSNNYVAILGVVFATIWTRKQNWNRGTNDSESSTSGSPFDPSPNRKTILSTIQFGPTQTHDARYTLQANLADDADSSSNSWSGGTKVEEKHQEAAV